MRRHTLWIIVALLLILSIVSARPLWMLWHITRPVTPHVQLIFGTSHICTLYLPYAKPDDLQFVGISLRHNLETRGGIVHEITISGTGTILYRNTNIDVGLGHISVDGQFLTDASCSYVLDRPGKMRIGAIHTYY
jgi:hypothetical protein